MNTESKNIPIGTDVKFKGVIYRVTGHFSGSLEITILGKNGPRKWNPTNGNTRLVGASSVTSI